MSSRPTVKRDLVIGAVRGYSFAQLRPFVVSLKRTAFKGDLVLLWNSLAADTRAELERHGVKLVHFGYRGSGALNSWSRFWPVLSKIVRRLNGTSLARSVCKAILPLQTSRFFHYRDFLSAHQDEYHRVLITDVRDVIFQGDPFAGIGDGVLAFEESAGLPLAEEKECNAIWVEKMFGPGVLAQIGRHPILCSGTIMGGVTAMIRFIDGLEQTLAGARDVGLGGSDQGLHNYFCRQINPSSVQICKNGVGPVLTMVPTLKAGVDFKVSATGEILGHDGLPVPVLHQYDRHAGLASQLVAQLAPA